MIKGSVSIFEPRGFGRTLESDNCRELFGEFETA